jgi:hypothetical protein
VRYLLDYGPDTPLVAVNATDSSLMTSPELSSGPPVRIFSTVIRKASQKEQPSKHEQHRNDRQEQRYLAANGLMTWRI